MRDLNRRKFLAALGAMAATAALPGKASAEPDQRSGRPDHFHGSVPKGPPEQIALLIYPTFTALDLIGPHTFLAALGNVKVHLVWKSLEPVTSDNGLRIHPPRCCSWLSNTIHSRRFRQGILTAQAIS